MAKPFSTIESSPAIFGDMLVVGTTGSKIYGVKIAGTEPTAPDVFEAPAATSDALSGTTDDTAPAATDEPAATGDAGGASE